MPRQAAKTSTLLIPGRPDRTVAPVGEVEGFLRVDVVHSASQAAAGRGAGAHEFGDARDDDVLELEFADGIRQWISVAQYRADATANGERGGRDTPLLIRPLPPPGAETRGVTEWILRALRVLRIRPDAAVADLAVGAVAAHFESKLRPGPGLYRIRLTTEPGEAVSARDLGRAGDVPLLLLLHGTFSNTHGSFAALCDERYRHRWDELLRAYGGRALAFEHRTLSQSPTANALEIARALPRDARLHVLSHSRGGLVGELLALGATTDAQLALWPRRDSKWQAFDKTDREQLRELVEVLRQKRLRIERFVRVACPARGTTLASGRLDRYLTVFLNLLGWIPVVRDNPVYAFAKAVALELIARRASPRDLPGLEAQIPDAPLIRFLNHPQAHSAADLAIIAGDLEARALSRKLLQLATDAFYQEDHDLVVQTRAMYGGLQRDRPAVFFFDQGPDVSHFSYFSNERTAERVNAWLLHSGDDLAGFEPMEPDEVRAIAAAPQRRGPAGPRPVVFVLPGIMGSTLSQDGERIWVSKHRLIMGGMKRLALDSPKVEADGLIASAYENLVEFLSDTHEVRPFPYDWRLPISQSGKRLAAAVEEVLAHTDQPVRLVAHSMGGLVARAMMAAQPQLWDRLCERAGGCLLMLGTPNWGSHVIPRLLVGQETLLTLLAVCDLYHSSAELLAWIARFPGLLDMLPQTIADPSDPTEYFDAEAWKAISQHAGNGAAMPTVRELADARNRLLGARLSHTDRIVYVAGWARATPIAIVFKPNGKVTFLATPAGDGRVSYVRGRMDGVRTWYTDAEHGDLADHEPAFSGYLELLQKGDTALLTTDPPAASRGPLETFEVRPDTASSYPDEEEFVAAATGRRPRQRRKSGARALRLSVRHADVTDAGFPVLVGHHQDDVIVSAERVIDRALHSDLSRRHFLGLYPGPLNTAEVVLQPDAVITGAIVIGLGPVGYLTPTQLTEGVALACLRYGLAAASPRAASGLGLSALLVGAGQGSRLAMVDSITAIVKGVLLANRKLAAEQHTPPVAVEQVQFIELFEDRAIAAAHQIRSLRQRLRLEEGETVVAAELLEIGQRGRRRTSASEGAEDWWRRIEITAERPDRLRYSVLTDRAGVAQLRQELQPQLIERLVESTVTSTGRDEHFAATLFQLLMPNDLKEMMAQGRDVVLVLDRTTANHPWELLFDQLSGRGEPPAVGAGFIRQLKTDETRPQPRYASDPAALVVGDPTLDDPQNQLAGARQEAKEVAETFRAQGYDVRWLSQPTATEVMTELFARPYQVIHLAGHGVYDETQPKLSGMILDGGVRLTAREIESMPVVPQLVFLNCCHLGQIDRRYNRLAAGIAVQLMQIGVRAVVAAGWAVDDQAAHRFAIVLYQALLSGTPFGAAVQQARRDIYDGFGAVNTWGAYQCYGDPQFTLRFTPPTVGAAPESAPWVARREVLDRLFNPQHTPATEIAAIEAALPAEWRADGEVLAALGHGYAQAGDFARAIEKFRAALGTERGTAPLDTAEKLANLQIRHAAAAHSPAGSPSPRRGTGAAEVAQARATVAAGIEDLQHLIAIAPTAERLSLLGSGYKRLAQLSDGTARRSALADALRQYERAAELARQRNGEDPYAVLNYLTLAYLVDRLPPTADELIRRCEVVGKQKLLAEQTLWNAVVGADAALLRALSGDSLERAEGPLAEQYARARGYGTAGEFQSVIDQLDFLIDMLHGPNAPGAAQARRARSATTLQRIRSELVRPEPAVAVDQPAEMSPAPPRDRTGRARRRGPRRRAPKPRRRRRGA